MLSDLRFALRQMVKLPVLSAVAVVALALGIGANTAIFSIIDAIFLRPLPYAQSERLVRLASSDPAHDYRQIEFSYPRFLAVRDGQKVFSDLAFAAATGFIVTGRGDPEQVRGIQASAEYLPTLGVQPLYGRNFRADEDRPGGAPVVMLSHNYWKQHFNSDPAVLGQALTLDGLPQTKYPNASALSTFFIRLQERLAAIPGVKSAALNDSPPLSGNAGPAPIAVVGRAVPPLGGRPGALRHLVGPNSFATLGIPLLRGRDFNELDRPDSPQTAIINEAFALQFFPGEDPLGRKIITGMGQKIAEIVGVVGDTRTIDLNSPPRSEYFLPALQRSENFTALKVRTEGEAASFANAVRAALREVDADQPLLNGQPLTSLIAQAVADRRLVMLLLGAFAGLALVLACLGVYSVMAYVVSQRTGEIGIRMALGACPALVQRMVLGEGLRLTLLGIGLGLITALGLTRLMAKLLFGVQSYDPLIYAGLSLLLCLVAAGA